MTASFAYRRDISKRLMRHYADRWSGLPMPRLQLRWSDKPVPKAQYRKEQGETNRFCKQMGFEPQPERKWDCFYELVLPVNRLDIRNEHYGAGFIIVPISWCRRGGLETNPPPCAHDGLDTPFRDGAHAYWDSKALGWLPVYVVAPDGTATQKKDYIDGPSAWAGEAVAA